MKWQTILRQKLIGAGYWLTQPQRLQESFLLLYSLILITGLPIMIGNSEIRGTLSNDMRSTLLSMTKTPIASISASELSSREWSTYPWMHEHVPTLLPGKMVKPYENSSTRLSGELIRLNVVVTK